MAEIKDLPAKETIHPNQNIGFGKVHTDHMLEANFSSGVWESPQIKPFGNIVLSPFSNGLHYGQTIFEGIKAFKTTQGKIGIFRLEDHYNRFCRSAERLCMPHIPKEHFIEGIKKLVAIDKNWVPSMENNLSMYIRPLMFANEAIIRIKISDEYKFLVLLSPSGEYFSQAVNILIEENYVRATPGGVGEVKMGGNYASSYYPTKMANDKGYDQVLWTDPKDGHKTLQEIGAMNVFFVIANKVITPKLDGSILHGITRDSIIKLLKDKKIEVVEKKITIDELLQSYQKNILQEAFGSGTAAIVSPIKSLTYKNNKIELNCDEYKIAPMLKKTFFEIRNHRLPDKYNWMTNIE